MKQIVKSLMRISTVKLAYLVLFAGLVSYFYATIVSEYQSTYVNYTSITLSLCFLTITGFALGELLSRVVALIKAKVSSSKVIG